MESEARYVRVGLLTLALIALLAAGLYWLAGNADDRAMKRFVVYFQKQSLEGLQINSNVRMQGVNVGNVIDYAIIGGEARKVRVLLQVDARTPVLEGAKAIIARHLVTGLAAVDLENPPQNGLPLTRVEEGEKYPVIPEGVPQLTRVADTLEELGVASREALSRFNRLLSDSNQRALSTTLSNLDGASGEIKRAMPALSAALDSTRRAADQVNGLGGEARQALQDTRQRLDRLASETTETLAQARHSFAKLDRDMTDLASQMKLTTDLSGQEIQSTAQSLRLAGDALQDTGRALANPARVLYGPSKTSLGPGEESK